MFMFWLQKSFNQPKLLFLYQIWLIMNLHSGIVVRKKEMQDLQKNKHAAGLVQNEVVLDDLFG